MICMLDKRNLRIGLAQAGLAQWQLAGQVGVSPAALSQYATGARECPPDVQGRLEKALGLETGALTAVEAANG